jgi:hypothetical protein
VPDKVSEALRVMGPYVANSNDVVDRFLDDLGYTHPGIPAQAWREFSPTARLETAYLSAEEAVPGGGERMLALLSRALAQEYESAANDENLRQFIKLKVEGRVAFREISDRNLSERRAKIAEPVRKAIEALSVYCEGGGFGMRAVLVYFFSIEPGRAEQIMRTGSTVQDILLRGAAEVSPANLDGAMVRLVSNLDREFESIRAERSLDHWRNRPQDRAAPISQSRWSGPKDSRPWKPDDGPLPPAPKGPQSGPKDKPKGPPIVDWRSHWTKGYDTFSKKNYGSSRPGSFRPVIKNIRGFGGVILGNDVSAPGIPELKGIEWKSDPDDKSSGLLRFHFPGKMADWPNVRADEAFAAYQIVFTGVSDPEGKNILVPPAIKGDAIGLVGLVDSVPYFDCGPERVVNDGRRWNFVLHPALADYPLGWSVLMCDALPLEELRPHLIRKIGERVTEKEAKRFQNVFEKSFAWTTYKFTDVPMEITLQGDKVSIQRKGEKGDEFPPELRKAAFLTLNLYSGRAVHDADKEFYPLVPSLTKASLDFERLNEFAKVLGVMRWAKDQGASFKIAPPSPARSPKAASIIVTRDGVIPAPAFETSEGLLELREKIRLRLTSLRISNKSAFGEWSKEMDSAIVGEWKKLHEPVKGKNEEEVFVHAIKTKKGLDERLRDPKAVERVKKSIDEKPKELQQALKRFQYWKDLQSKLMGVEAALLAHNLFAEDTKSGQVIFGALSKQKDSAVHSVALAKGGTYQIDLRTNDFDSVVAAVLSKRDVRVNRDGGEGLNSRIVITPENDNPVKIMVGSVDKTAFDRLPGAYSLQIRPLELSVKRKDLEGKLSKDDPLLKEVKLSKDLILKDVPYRVFPVVLERGRTYQIDLMSKDFDAFLIIKDAKGRIIDLNDDGPEGFGLDSQIQFAPKRSGTYEIVATCLPETGLGNFRIRISEFVFAPDKGNEK